MSGRCALVILTRRRDFCFDAAPALLSNSGMLPWQIVWRTPPEGQNVADLKLLVS